jgi:hypothetical protein
MIQAQAMIALAPTRRVYNNDMVLRRIKEDSGQLVGPPDLSILERIDVSMLSSTTEKLASM